MSNKNLMTQATRHFSKPNKFLLFIFFLIPPLFRLMFVSCLPWLLSNQEMWQSIIRFSAELLKPFPEGDLSALKGAGNHEVGLKLFLVILLQTAKTDGHASGFTL